MNLKPIAVSLLLAVTLYGQGTQTPIYNGLLQSDLNAAGFKILSANLADYAGTGLTWNVVTGKFDAAGGGGTGTVTSISALSPLFTTPDPITTTGILSFTAPGISGNVLTSNGTTWVSLPLPAAGGSVSDTAYGAGWNGSTTVAPSQNALYDWAHTFDTNDNGTPNKLDLIGISGPGVSIVGVNNTGIVSIATPGTDYESLLTFADSLNRTGSSINLDGDNPTPGASKYYGTDGTSAKGWFALPAAGGVTSWNTRTGAVVPATNDYSFAQLSGDFALTQTPSATASRLIGRGAGSAGDWQEITVGSGLSMTGTTLAATAGGGGTVTDFSAGDLSPLFTTTEATTTTTPALSFSLTSAAANTVFGRAAGTSGAPTYSSAPQFLKIGNLTTNGFVKTGSSDGTLSVDTSTYLTSTSISDTAYAGTWDTVTTIAPSKNAVYDKIETLQPLDTDLTAIAGISGVQGDVLYYGASGWTKLAAGTSGDFLKTQGAAANPVWATPGGGGTVTSTGTTGNIAKFSSATNITNAVSGTDYFAAVTGVQGDVLYHNGTSWVKLAAGTNGNQLTTHSTGANPTWDAPSTGATGGAPIVYLQTTAQNPTGTSSSVMAGLAHTSVSTPATITPQGTGKIFVTATGMMSNNTNVNGAAISLRYGTTFPAPANGAGLTGTLIGSVPWRAAGSGWGADMIVPFSVSGVISGLTAGVPIWIDLQQSIVTGGTATLASVTVAAFEVPTNSVTDGIYPTGWDTDTGAAPSRNSVRDYVHLFDTDDDGKVNVLDTVAGLVKTDASGVVSNAVAGTDYQAAGAYLTANQPISLTGDVTGGPAATSIATTIGANKVTLGMMATMATDSILGRATAATGNVEVLAALPFAYTGDVTRPVDSNVTTLAAGNAGNLNSGTLLAARMPALTGDVTTTVGTVATTYNNAVPTAKAGLPTGGTANQVLSKIDGTNYNTQWVTPGGGGNVSNSGTPTVDQLGIWVTATTIKGVTALPATNFPALTGDVTTTAGALATTIGANKVTLPMMATMATDSILGRATASTGNVEVLTSLPFAWSGGDVARAADSNTETINTNAVTYAKMQDITATNRFLGRITAGAGDPEELTAANAKTILALTSSDVGLGSVTNDAQTKASIVPNTAPSAGQILAGNAGGTAYAPVTVSGSGATISLASTGVMTIGSIANASLDSDLAAIGNISGVRGDVLFYGASGWAKLAAGTAGNQLTTQGASADPTWAAAGGGGGGSGDVVGPASAADTNVALFDGTTGKLLKASNLTWDTSNLYTNNISNWNGATFYMSGGGWFAFTQTSGTGLQIASPYGLLFTSSGTVPATPDTGFSRNAAGVLEINNGTAGQYRDLKARQITLQGSASGIFQQSSNGVLIYGNGTTQDLVVDAARVSMRSGQPLVWVSSPLDALGGTGDVSLYRSAAGELTVGTGGASGTGNLKVNNLTVSGTCTGCGGGGGSGDVVGPASATDNAIARFDTTTGKLIQDSAVSVADTTGLMSWGGDTGIGRNAAGVLEVNNGTAGQYRDIKVDEVDAVTGYKVNGTATGSDYFNSSVSDQSLTTSDAYITGSSVVVPAGAFKAKGQYRCVFDSSKTAGTGAIVITLRVGTAGTTADTSRITFTFGSGTSVSDGCVFDIIVNWRTVGSGTSAVVAGSCRAQHNLATTGFFNNAAAYVILGTPSGGFNSSADTTIGLSFNGGTAFSGLIRTVQATLLQ